MPIALEEADFEAQIARVQQELRDLDKETASPEVSLKATDLRAELQRLKAELAALSAKTYDVKVGEDGITAVTAKAFDLKAVLAELARQPVQIEFDAKENDLLRKIAEVEAALNKIDGKTVTPEIQADIDKALAKLVGYQRELDKLDGERIKTVAELDVDTLKADARITAFLTRMRLRRDIKLPVDVDLKGNTLAGQLTRLGKSSGLLSNMGAALNDVFSGIGATISGISNNFGTLTARIGATAAAVGQVAIFLAQAGGLSIALAAAGAGISAAYGAVATAISTIPAAVALIGVPLAAVMLGLDGVKKAAAGIKPEFDKLKASVSDVFEKGLTPILNNIASRVFPTLKAGLTDTARALVDLAGRVADVVIRSAELGQLKIIFDNVNASIRNMTPGITDLVNGFLLLAQQRGAFDVLTSAVNTFGRAFKDNVVATIRDGSLTAAFEGLKGTLDAVAQGFADLVKNGIELFAAAAPGVNAFLNDLTGFFNRFNWTELGTAVGGVFKGLGDTLRNVPQGTIDSIAASFSRLSQVFQDPAFQAGLQAIIALIPGAIDWAGRLAEAFSRTALALRGSFDVIVGAVKSIALALQALTNDPSLLFSEKFKADLDAANAQVTKGLGEIEQSYAKFDPQLPPSNVAGQIGTEMGTAVATAEQKMAALKVALQRGMSEAQTIMVGGWKGVGSATATAVTSALAPIPQIAQGSVSGTHAAIVNEIAPDRIGRETEDRLKVVPTAVTTALQPTAGNASAALTGVPSAVSGELGQVPPAAEGALAPLAQLQALVAMQTSFGVAFLNLVGTTTLGMQSISAAVADGMPGIVAAFNFQNVGTQLGLAFQALVGTATLGMASLAATVAGGMPAIVAAFNFQNVGLQIGLAFQGIVGTFTLGMASLAATVTAGMPTIVAAFNFQNVGTQVGLAFQGLVGTVTLGMASFSAAVTTGMLGVQTAFTTGLTGLQTALATTFSTGLTTTVTTGMAGLATAVNDGFGPIEDAIIFNGTIMQAAFHVAIGLMATDAGVQMQLVANQVDAGMQGITETINSNMVIAQTAMNTGIAGLATIATFAMAGVTQAIAAGMAEATASVQNGMAGLAAGASAGMAGVVAAVNAGMGQAVAAVESAGARIGAAGTASMAQFGAAISSGMAQATAAVAGGTAQMNAQFVALGQQIVASAVQSMALFGNSVRAGMSQATSAVVAGVAAMVGALRAGAGQFNSVGVQMMQGLRAGILSQSSSIAAAAAAVVRGAIASARAAANVHSPSRVFMEIGSFMGEGLAVGMESAAPRVARAADEMVSAATDTADKISAAFSGNQLGSDLSAKIEHSFGDATSTISTKDVVGQLRKLNGNVDQSSYLGAIVSLLQVIVAQSNGSGGAAMGAQSSRRSAELGAF